ncbi:MAG: hypothetical protein MUF78_02140 [Candidatus Edwardsbacteria bacterium]|nr:hypothetical protein [Candidatus Edwardsbacteria bacterium]
MFGSGRVRAPEAVAAAAASGVSGGTAAVVPAAGSGLRCAGANPGRGSFELWYDVPAAGRGRVAVYNIAGQLVRVLADDCLRAGRHRIIWDGRNTAGQAAAPGVYLATARQGGVTCALRLVNLR